jgi:hypothetical protein
VREVGLLVWVVLLIVGVTGSIASSIRKAGAAKRPGGTPQRPGGLGPGTPPPRADTVRDLVSAIQAQARAQAQAQAAPQAVRQPLSRPAVPPKPRAVPSSSERQVQQQQQTSWPEAIRHPSAARRLFAGRGDAVRGIIAAEILGSPRGLRDEPFWR